MQLHSRSMAGRAIVTFYTDHKVVKNFRNYEEILSRSRFFQLNESGSASEGVVSASSHEHGGRVMETLIRKADVSADVESTEIDHIKSNRKIQKYRSLSR